MNSVLFSMCRYMSMRARHGLRVEASAWNQEQAVLRLLEPCWVCIYIHIIWQSSAIAHRIFLNMSEICLGAPVDRHQLVWMFTDFQQGSGGHHTAFSWHARRCTWSIQLRSTNSLGGALPLFMRPMTPSGFSSRGMKPCDSSVQGANQCEFCEVIHRVAATYQWRLE